MDENKKKSDVNRKLLLCQIQRQESNYMSSIFLCPNILNLVQTWVHQSMLNEIKWLTYSNFDSVDVKAPDLCRKTHCGGIIIDNCWLIMRFQYTFFLQGIVEQNDGQKRIESIFKARLKLKY